MKPDKTRFKRFLCAWIYQGLSNVEIIKSEPQLNPLKSILFMGKWWGACNAPVHHPRRGALHAPFLHVIYIGQADLKNAT